MGSRTTRIIYGLLLFFITLTGFAQMPIFKRYYIADIPGLGWLAQFYLTHSLHYILASCLITLAAFWVVDALLNRKTGGGFSRLGLIKAGCITGLILTGGFMVVRNLPGIYFSHISIHIMNLAHLGFCMVLLAVSVLGLVIQKRGNHSADRF
jgi:hypothetical protein